MAGLVTRGSNVGGPRVRGEWIAIAFAGWLASAGCQGAGAVVDGSTGATGTSATTGTTTLGATLTEATTASGTTGMGSSGSTSGADASGSTSTTSSGTTTTGVGASSSAGDSTTGENGTPPPAGRRWVLRDVDGVGSNAVVEPTCRFTSDSGCTLPDVGHTGPISPQCIRVIWLDGQYVDLKYASETGRAEDCAPPPSTEVAPGPYATPDCAPPAYTSAGEGTDEAFRWTRRVHGLDNGEVLYVSVDSPTVDVVPGYAWNGNPGSCVQNPFLQGVQLSPRLPIPDWAADALPNPPYTLSWE